MKNPNGNEFIWIKRDDLEAIKKHNADMEKEIKRLNKNLKISNERNGWLKERLDYVSRDFTEFEYRQKIAEINKARELERERSQRIMKKYKELKRRCGIK